MPRRTDNRMAEYRMAELRTMAAQYRLKIRNFGRYHCRIVGTCRVDYWAFKAKAWKLGEPAAIANVEPIDAVRLALSL